MLALLASTPRRHKKSKTKREKSRTASRPFASWACDLGMARARIADASARTVSTVQNDSLVIGGQTIAY
jgi:hypothetical protein